MYRQTLTPPKTNDQDVINVKSFIRGRTLTACETSQFYKSLSRRKYGTVKGN